MKPPLAMPWEMREHVPREDLFRVASGVRDRSNDANGGAGEGRETGLLSMATFKEEGAQRQRQRLLVLGIMYNYQIC